MRTASPIKVLIVDDSRLVRTILTRVLSDERDIAVVGGANDPYEARDLIVKFRPDVIILDIAMPRMDGLTFLKKLMEHYPVPVIMCSGVAPTNSGAAIQALEYGAVDVVTKPAAGGSAALKALGLELADKIRAAAVALPALGARRRGQDPDSGSFRAAGLDPRRYVIAIGASTGGTEAIRAVLDQAPPDWPPVVMVQHMPEGFTRSFAERLNDHSELDVREAVDGDALLPGQALLARGGVQMTVQRGSTSLCVRYGSRELHNRHCPSVDVLFDSVAAISGRKLIGILLTGMGADGAKGLLNMREAGALTIGQTRHSCVVYGMPKVAAEIGAVQHTGAPPEIPAIILRALRRPRNELQRVGSD